MKVPVHEKVVIGSRWSLFMVVVACTIKTMHKTLLRTHFFFCEITRKSVVAGQIISLGSFIPNTACTLASMHKAGERGAGEERGAERRVERNNLSIRTVCYASSGPHKQFSASAVSRNRLSCLLLIPDFSLWFAGSMRAVSHDNILL